MPRLFLPLWPRLQHRLRHTLLPLPQRQSAAGAFRPMAVLRDPAQAYKKPPAPALQIPVAAPDDSSASTQPPAPMPRGQEGPGQQQTGHNALAAPQRRATTTRRHTATAAVPPSATYLPQAHRIRLSGRMADVCAELERLARQEELFLRAG